MTDSRIMQTIDRFLCEERREQITGLDSYKVLREDLEYFEQFVRHQGVPDVVGLVDDVISNGVQQAEYSEFKPARNDSSDLYCFSTSGTDVVTIGYRSLIGVQVKGRSAAEDCGKPTIQINRFGYNRPGERDYAEKGVQLQCYSIPRDVAGIVLDEFTRLEGERNGIILELARLQELTLCYPKDHWVNFQIDYIRKGNVPEPGIDETSVFGIERDVAGVNVYGYANGFNHARSTVNLDIRIEVVGEEFQFPSQR